MLLAPAGVPTKIVGVGGSITTGHGAADGHAYMNWLEKYTHAYIGKACRLVVGPNRLVSP
jgi:hypothetical protein